MPFKRHLHLILTKQYLKLRLIKQKKALNLWVELCPLYESFSSTTLSRVDYCLNLITEREHHLVARRVPLL